MSYPSYNNKHATHPLHTVHSDAQGLLMDVRYNGYHDLFTFVDEFLK